MSKSETVFGRTAATGTTHSASSVVDIPYFVDC